jgi:transcriptional regulator with XRE-family HTH domain
MVLFRRLLGDVLRRHRQRQARTLRDVAAAARISLGYLSEVERGRKEASSELLAALCAALGISLADVLAEVSSDIARLEGGALTPVGFTAGRVATRIPASAPVRPVATLATAVGRTDTVAPVATLSALLSADRLPVVAA